MSLRRLPLFAALGSIGAAVLAAAPPLAAQTPSYGSLDDMFQSFQEASFGWFDPVYRYTLMAFWALAGLEVAFMGTGWLLAWISGRLRLAALLAQALGKLAFFGIFFFTLQAWPYFYPKIIKTFQTIGADISGVPAFSPSSVVDRGIFFAAFFIETASRFGITDITAALCALALALVVFAAHLVVGWRLMALLIETQITLTAGFLPLGFASNRGTVGMAESYIVHLFRLGLKTFLTYIAVAIAIPMTEHWLAVLNSFSLEQHGFTLFFRLAAEAVVYAGIVLTIPQNLSYALTAPSGFLHLREALLARY